MVLAVKHVITYERLQFLFISNEEHTCFSAKNKYMHFGTYLIPAKAFRMTKEAKSTEKNEYWYTPQAWS
jgi:hypothetical protein